jgi:NitT/TauT family transport system substrate-binding protein
MADKDFIQLCFITNEPFFIRENVANPKTVLIADSGYDPDRVIFTSKNSPGKTPKRCEPLSPAPSKAGQAL